MKGEMRVTSIFLLATLVLAMTPLCANARNVPLRYTRRLPQIDRVELQKVQSGELGIGSILATKIIEGKQAQTFAALWRMQKFRSMVPDCHQPGFAIKFYARGKLLLYASLCWDCDNIEFLEPRLGGYQGFNGSSRKGRALLALLQNSFS